MYICVLIYLTLHDPTHTHTDLVDLVVLCLVLGHEVEEELFGVPVEEWREVSVHIKTQGTKVILLPRHCILRNILTEGGGGGGGKIMCKMEEEEEKIHTHNNTKPK